MNLRYDRELSISMGNSRKDMHWKPLSISVSGLWDRLSVPVRGSETTAEYFKLPKSRQDSLKDVGGFVGGHLNGERRKAGAVTGRDIITLDFDTIPAYGTEDVAGRVAALGCAYAIYSTRKHVETAPRLRVLIPLSRTATADEYEPCARRMAEQVGIQMADPTTFEASRLMYWPSCCLDGDFFFRYGDAPFADPDKILSTYADWRDMASWPQVPNAPSPQRLAAKQASPESKEGIVGAFCRAYSDVRDAMAAFLPGAYEPVEGDPDRYTYTGGSTTGGAVIYDGGKFLFSHHATDPCSGKLVNSFDLVRLHLFGDKDDEAEEGARGNRLPSYIAMCEFATADKKCIKLLSRERREAAMKDFEGMGYTPGNSPEGEDDEDGEDSSDWEAELDRTKEGRIKPTIDNVLLILDNDPDIKGKFALNKFAGRGEVLGVLPWDASGARRLWCDTDNNGLYWFMEKVHEVTKRASIDAALDIHAAKHAFNEVQDYIRGLEWDGAERLDRLFIDYLGAEDDEAGYNRAVTRKALTAAVARAMQPGCKYDNMLILCGPQGIGKSTILDRLSRGWFNDSIRTFEGKEAAELLPGVWIVEVAELDAFRRTDVSRIKQFLSLRADRYRAAYGRNMKEQPRSCVFFGTCNQMEFLQDTTGNRRFWPVDVGKAPAVKNVWKDLTEDVIAQVWAEAKVRWQVGEPLYLTGALEEAAKARQEQHRDQSPWEGMVHEFMERPVPSDWLTWDLDRRREYWARTTQGSYELVPRDRISAMEVWCELLGGRALTLSPADRKEITKCFMTASGWTRSDKPFRGGKPYGLQRGFIKKVSMLTHGV